MGIALSMLIATNKTLFVPPARNGVDLPFLAKSWPHRDAPTGIVPLCRSDIPRSARAQYDRGVCLYTGIGAHTNRFLA